MKKRLLCYDEDNPVGIDENGVLNPSALGGGALFRYYNGENATFTEGSGDQSIFMFVDKNLVETYVEASNNGSVLPFAQLKFGNAYYYTLYGNLSNFDNEAVIFTCYNGVVKFDFYVFKTYEAAFDYYNR